MLTEDLSSDLLAVRKIDDVGDSLDKGHTREIRRRFDGGSVRCTRVSGCARWLGRPSPYGTGEDIRTSRE